MPVPSAKQHKRLALSHEAQAARLQEGVLGTPKGPPPRGVGDPPALRHENKV